MTYTLGSSPEEQERLLWQSKAYGDLATLSIMPGTLVECGCGVGANLWIVPQFSIKQYIGFDISEEQIVRAKKTAEQLHLNNVRLFQGNAYDEKALGDGIADVVLIRLVLVHLGKPDIVLRNLKHALKPGGRLISIEAEDHRYSVGPGMNNLQKCWQKRCELAYEAGRGSMDIANRLGGLFADIEMSKVHIRPHFIDVTGGETERMRKFLDNWLIMLSSVSSELVERGMITPQELADAKSEAASFDGRTRLHQKLVICEGVK